LLHNSRKYATYSVHDEESSCINYQESDKLFPEKKLSVRLSSDELRFWRKLKADLPMDNSRLLLRFALFFSSWKTSCNIPNSEPDGSNGIDLPFQHLYNYSELLIGLFSSLLHFSQGKEEMFSLSACLNSELSNWAARSIQTFLSLIVAAIQVRLALLVCSSYTTV